MMVSWQNRKRSPRWQTTGSGGVGGWGESTKGEVEDQSQNLQSWGDQSGSKRRRQHKKGSQEEWNFFRVCPLLGPGSLLLVSRLSCNSCSQFLRNTACLIKSDLFDLYRWLVIANLCYVKTRTKGEGYTNLITVQKAIWKCIDNRRQSLNYSPGINPWNPEFPQF